MKALGLDLSLTATGVCALVDGELVLSELVKSKPSGKKPINEVERLEGIVQEIGEYIEQHQPDIIAIEGLAFMARNTTALVQLAGLNYLVRCDCKRRGIDFVIVAPSSLKKFVTGKGNAPKDHMMLETYKKYDLTLLDDNLVDAHALARVGEAMIGGGPLINKVQQQVVDLVKTQL